MLRVDRTLEICQFYPWTLWSLGTFLSRLYNTWDSSQSPGFGAYLTLYFVNIKLAINFFHSCQSSDLSILSAGGLLASKHVLLRSDSPYTQLSWRTKKPVNQSSRLRRPQFRTRHSKRRLQRLLFAWAVTAGWSGQISFYRTRSGIIQQDGFPLSLGTVRRRLSWKSYFLLQLHCYLPSQVASILSASFPSLGLEGHTSAGHVYEAHLLVTMKPVIREPEPACVSDARCNSSPASTPAVCGESPGASANTPYLPHIPPVPQ